MSEIWKMRNKRLNELLNIKDEQIEHTKRSKAEIELHNKFKQKLKALEEHYEARITDLSEELNFYKKSTHSKAALKSEGTKSSKSIRKNTSKPKKENLASISTFGKICDPETSYREDVDLDTDITPAEELNSTDRRRMIEKAENIGNDSLLVSFYKKKIEDRQHEQLMSHHMSKHQESPRQRHNQNYTHRTSAPLKPRDENVDHEAMYNSNSTYLQSSSQRQISAYVSKHYQIPKKVKSVHMDTQCTVNSEVSDTYKKIQNANMW